MSELMNSIKREIMFLTKLFQPAVGRLRIHRHTVPFCEQAVVLYPLAAEPILFFFLFCFELFKNLNHFRRQLYETHRGLGFCRVCVNAIRICVVGCTLNVYYSCLKVNVFPFKPQHFTSAHTAVNIQREECTPF